MKESAEEISRPLTLIDKNLNLNLLFFLEVKNWEKEKNKDAQSKKFPKNATISLFIILLFKQYKN